MPPGNGEGNQGAAKALASLAPMMNLGGKLDDDEMKIKSLKHVFDETWMTRNKKGRTKPCCGPMTTEAFPNWILAVNKGLPTPQDCGVPNPVMTLAKQPALKKGYKWQTLNLTVDSGACDHVINPAEFPSGEVKITQAVKEGVVYTSASGDPIPNLGELDVEAYTADGTQLNMSLQVADVNKPLAAVRKMCRAGNRVVFDDEEEGGYVEDKKTGVRTPITYHEGTYAVQLWVQVPVESPRGNNQFNSLREEDQELVFGDVGFIRPA